MGAVWYRGRAVLRHRLGSTVVLILLVGLTGGVVLTSVAGARRGRDAVPGFLAYARGPTIGAQVDPRLSQADQVAVGRRLLDDAPWDPATVIAQPVFTLPAQPGVPEGSGFVGYGIVDGPYLSALDRPIVVDGTLPDPASPDDVAVNEAFANGVGVGVGDTFRARTVTPEHLDQVVNSGFKADPDGTDVRLRVAAIIRQPWDLAQDPLAQRATIFSVRLYSVALTEAWWERYGDRTASYNVIPLGRAAPHHSTEDVATALADAAGDQVTISTEDPRLIPLAGVRRAIDLQANALLLFALVLTVAGLLLIGQAIGRQAGDDQSNALELRALGVRRRARAAVSLLRGVLIGGLGAVVAIAVAVVLSPVTPIGLARQAETHPGLHVDVVVLACGGALVAVLVAGWSWFAGWRAAAAGEQARAAPLATRPSRLVRRLSETGAPVTTVTGIRFALERGQEGSATPVVSALVVTTAGIAVVVAAIVFSSSLGHVVGDPAARGWTWDVAVGAFFQPGNAEEAARTLDDDPGVRGSQGFSSSQQVRIDGRIHYLSALGPGDPEIGPRVLEGRLPARRGEIALGHRTLAELHKQVGDHVRLGDSGGDLEARIVGAIVPPATLDGSLTLDEGGVVTLDDLDVLVGGEPGDDAVVPEQFLVDIEPTADRQAVLDRLESSFPGTVLQPTQPTDIQNLGRIEALPSLVAALVALLALATLANALVGSVHRRRRDLALLATLGFRRRQLAACVAWQATTVAAIALVIGVPLGVAAGRVVWRLVIDPVAAYLEPVVPLLALVAVPIVWLAVANLVAALPARAAARTHPATILRED